MSGCHRSKTSTTRTKSPDYEYASVQASGDVSESACAHASCECACVRVYKLCVRAVRAVHAVPCVRARPHACPRACPHARPHSRTHARTHARTHVPARASHARVCGMRWRAYITDGVISSARVETDLPPLVSRIMHACIQIVHPH